MPLNMPQAPWDLQEECELFARESGRHAKLHFFMGAGWFVRFTPRPGDPQLRAVQEGKLDPEVAGEDVFFHRVRKGSNETHDFEPLDIVAMGRSGVRSFLEEGNTWSGRGLFSSVVEAHQKATAEDMEQREQLKERLAMQARDIAKDRRRSLLKIPFVRVLIDLKGK